jgi:hypothetical protein
MWKARAGKFGTNSIPPIPPVLEISTRQRVTADNKDSGRFILRVSSRWGIQGVSDLVLAYVTSAEAEDAVLLTTYAVCVFPRLQETWHDQFEHIPQNIQVHICFNFSYRFNFSLESETWLTSKQMALCRKGMPMVHQRFMLWC